MKLPLCGLKIALKISPEGQLQVIVQQSALHHAALEYPIERSQRDDIGTQNLQKGFEARELYGQ